MNTELIKRDIRALRNTLFGENDINDWSKIIILYNIFLMYNFAQLNFYIMDSLNNSTASFREEFGYIYMFFFFLCSLKTSYLYLILNVSKVDYKLGNSLHNNFKEYFM
jgi:hypothetical protein